MAKRDALLAYSNYSNALHRMLREPKTQQKHTQTYNDLLIASHVLTTEVCTIVYLDQYSHRRLSETGLIELRAISKALNNQTTLATESPPDATEPAANLYAHPIQQMQDAIKRIIIDLKALRIEPLTQSNSTYHPS